jgi:hypothetical protein
MTGDYKRSTICVNTKQAIAYLQECLEKASRTSDGNKKPVWVSVLRPVPRARDSSASSRWDVLLDGGPCWVLVGTHRFLTLAWCA